MPSQRASRPPIIPTTPAATMTSSTNTTLPSTRSTLPSTPRHRADEAEDGAEEQDEDDLAMALEATAFLGGHFLASGLRGFVFACVHILSLSLRLASFFLFHVPDSRADLFSFADESTVHAVDPVPWSISLPSAPTHARTTTSALPIAICSSTFSLPSDSISAHGRPQQQGHCKCTPARARLCRHVRPRGGSAQRAPTTAARRPPNAAESRNAGGLEAQVSCQRVNAAKTANTYPVPFFRALTYGTVHGVRKYGVILGRITHNSYPAQVDYCFGSGYRPVV
ncbi:hypothetical protein C8R45DRAFT_1080731 [Mycena sanguinolenta]|nr:hypothetical protein C8R45DRAFT_1080731 [Mycena sanguinolenta]